MLREDSLKREMMESMKNGSGRKINKNEEKYIIARHEQDIKYRQIKQKEMQKEKQAMETEDISRMFKPQILDRSK